jgi:integrase
MRESKMRGLVIYKKRGEKYVRIRFWLQGRRQEEFFGRATPENVQAAKKKLAEYRLKQTAGTLRQEFVERSVTVAEACDHYLQYKLTEPGTVKPGGSKRPGYSMYEKACHYFKKFIGTKLLHDVNVNDIRQFREWRAKMPVTRWQWKRGCFGQKESGRAVGFEVVTNRKVSFATINREQTVISNLFNVLRELRATGEINFKLPIDNPCRYVTKPSEDNRRRTRVISLEEYERLIEHADPDMRLILRFALVTMLRRSDLMGLTQLNYRPVTHTLEGVQSKTGLPFKVGIPSDLEEVCLASGNGPLLNFRDFPRRWRKLRKDVNMPELQMRDLRRSAASWALKKSKDIALISATLGHRDIEMTQRYLGVISEARQDIANTLGDLFAAPEKLERVMGIEPTSGAWEAPILPLNYTREDMPELPEETVSQLYPKDEILFPENDKEPIEFSPEILQNEINRRQQLGKLSFCH